MPEAKIDGYKFHYHLVNGCAVVRPEGACDTKTTEALARLVDSPLLDSKHLILDLSHSDYVESPGFRWIVRQVMKLEEAGKRLILAGLPPQVKRAFELLKLDDRVCATDDVAGALAKANERKDLVAA